MDASSGDYPEGETKEKIKVPENQDSTGQEATRSNDSVNGGTAEDESLDDLEDKISEFERLCKELKEKRAEFERRRVEAEEIIREIHKLRDSTALAEEYLALLSFNF